ncbi:CLOCK-interacting pacemaker a [Colossoma macropomum]|uniref:CLOCK-interacting pacemaker a n=1 Tax=Colossoma macropomum TaxID=42526 RepID=UPI001863A485|nr:CLOCK-interacting pacemaker a [Colossoma macropomum]XP_036449750.1 CLOCK-interacting pacemaker a [Colossoma macropomum]XP_036449751.1 CLOCK-interacting pacemaker a [Colossoma macropomum]
MANKTKRSKTELERDSGFSDASSGYFSAVEFEDIRSRSSATENMQSGPQAPVVPGSYQDVSPVVKMNSFIVKQPSPVTPALKPWGFNPSLEVVPRSPVVLLQPVVPSSNCTSQTPASQQRQSKNYIPILNSFLKIAPHPVNGAAGDLRQSSIRKSNSGHSHSGRRRHNDKQSRALSLKKSLSESNTVGSHSGDPCMYSHSSENMDSSTKFPDLKETNATTTPFSHSPRSPLSDACPKTAYASSDDDVSLSPSSSKRKRFCNTYNILNQSGLLGITMRTKELIRQNKRSQAQLQKLQAHTDLFLEAMSSRDPQVWAKLQLTLQSPASEESKEDTVGNTGLDGTAIGCV